MTGRPSIRRIRARTAVSRAGPLVLQRAPHRRLGRLLASVVRHSAVGDLDHHDIGGEVDSVAVEHPVAGRRRSAPSHGPRPFASPDLYRLRGMQVSRCPRFNLDPTAGAQHERLPSIFGNWMRAGAARFVPKVR